MRITHNPYGSNFVIKNIDENTRKQLEKVMYKYIPETKYEYHFASKECENNDCIYYGVFGDDFSSFNINEVMGQHIPIITIEQFLSVVEKPKSVLWEANTIDLTKILKVGDPVTDVIFGEGVIECIDSDPNYPINVYFSQMNSGYCYSKKGNLYETNKRHRLIPNETTFSWENYEKEMTTEQLKDYYEKHENIKVKIKD